MPSAVSKKKEQPKQVEQKSGTEDVDRIRDDIKSKFPNFSVKYLWSTGNCHRFRINLFTTENGTTQISKSHFVHSTIEGDKISHEIRNIEESKRTNYLKDIVQETDKKEDIFWTSEKLN